MCMHARSVLDSFAFVGCAQHDRFKHAHFVLDSFAFVGCVLHDRFLCICLHSWHPLLSQVCDFAPAAGCFQSAAMVLVSEHVHPCSLDFWNQRRVVLLRDSQKLPWSKIRLKVKNLKDKHPSWKMCSRVYERFSIKIGHVPHACTQSAVCQV